MVMSELVEFSNECYEYDSNGRMCFNPDFHENHGKPFTLEDLEYLCKFWEHDDVRTIAFALGRTEATLFNMVKQLRQRGLFDFYKNMNLFWVGR